MHSTPPLESSPQNVYNSATLQNQQITFLSAHKKIDRVALFSLPVSCVLPTLQILKHPAPATGLAPLPKLLSLLRGELYKWRRRRGTWDAQPANASRSVCVLRCLLGWPPYANTLLLGTLAQIVAPLRPTAAPQFTRDLHFIEQKVVVFPRNQRRHASSENSLKPITLYYFLINP